MKRSMEKSMKKVRNVAMILMLSLFVCGCKKADTSDTKSANLYDKGLDIIHLMDEMVKNDAVGTSLGVANLKNQVEGLKQGDYQTPKSVYKVSLPKKLEDIIQDDANDILSMEDMSEELKKQMCQKLFQNTGVQQNGRFGAEQLATAATYTVNQLFVCNELDENVYYVYLFENGYPVIVDFIVGDNHAVSANGHFILESVVDDSTQGVQKLLSEPFQIDYKIEKVEK